MFIALAISLPDDAASSSGATRKVPAARTGTPRGVSGQTNEGHSDRSWGTGQEGPGEDGRELPDL